MDSALELSLWASVNGCSFADRNDAGAGSIMILSSVATNEAVTTDGGGSLTEAVFSSSGSVWEAEVCSARVVGRETGGLAEAGDGPSLASRLSFSASISDFSFS